MGWSSKLILGLTIVLVLFMQGCSINITGHSISDGVSTGVNIVNAKPLAPELIYPIDVYTFNRARFAWEEAIDYNYDPLRYNIQISDDMAFPNYIINVMTDKLTYEIPFNLSYGIYYYRVRAYDGEDFGAFSKITSFGIKSPDDKIEEDEENSEDKAPQQATVVPIDSDGDGVYDSQDKCPNTDQSLNVDYRGCACNQKKCNDSNICTKDYCDESTATCRYSFDNEQSCGKFTECPTDTCSNRNYIDYTDGFGKCVDGFCFENECNAKEVILSERCEVKKDYTDDDFKPEHDNKNEFEVGNGYYSFYNDDKEIPFNENEEMYDSDNDGVPNYKDRCALSKNKFVDKYGCTCEQKRCIDLDENTIDLCYRGKCIFAIEDSLLHNQTLKYISKDKEKVNFLANPIVKIGLIGLFVYLLIIELIIKRKEHNR